MREFRPGLVAALCAGLRRAGAEDDFGVGVCDAEFEPEGSEQAVEFGRVVARDPQLVVGCAGQVQHFADGTECAAQGCEPVRVGAGQEHHRDECFDLAASGGWIDLRCKAGDDARSAQSSDAVGCRVGTEADFGAEVAPGQSSVFSEKPEDNAAGAALVGVGFALTAIASTTGGYLLSVAVWTFGEIFPATVTGAIVARLAPEALRGRYSGLYSLAVASGWLTSSLGGTRLLSVSPVGLWGSGRCSVRQVRTVSCASRPDCGP